MNVRELFFKSEPKSQLVTPFPRCQHRSPAGRQCSQPICSTSAEFCFTHKPKPEDLLIAELTEAAGALSHPEEIHRFLTRVTLLRIQGRITPKEACSYAYMCQILQRGQREIAFHHKLREDRAAREAEQARVTSALSASWNIPRPDRSDPSGAPTSDQSASAISTDANSSSAPIATISSKTEAAQQTPAEGESASSVCHPDRSSRAFPLRSGGTVATNHTPAPTDGTNTPSTEKSPPKKSKRSAKTAAAKSSESSTSSVSQAPSTPPRPLPPDFYNHFFPIDFTLPPGAQDHAKNIPHPDAAECARRNARRGLDFSRHRRSVSHFFSLWRR